MNVGTPTPDDENNDAVQAAEEIVAMEAEAANVQAVFTLAIRVGTALVQWRDIMIEGGYSQEFVEDTATTMFHKFFTPFVPEFQLRHDDDD